MPPDETTTSVPAAPAADAPPTTPPAAPPDTVTISREEWDRFNARMAHLDGQVQGMVASAGRQAPPPPVPEVTYTDEQLAEMVDQGGLQAVKAHRYIAQQQMRPVVDEFVNFRAATITTAESLGRDVVEASGKIPHYKDPEIKRQVDAFMATLPPEARANKESLVLAHNYVVGQPENFERLVTKRVEEEVRKRAGNPNVADATTAAGRVPASPGSTVPSVRELLGDGAAQALKAQGRTPDEFAKRMGYKSWEAYAKEIESTSTPESEELQ